MPRAVFSSDELPAHLSDRARLSTCQDLYSTRYGCHLNFSRSEDQPFWVRFEFARFGDLVLGQFQGTLTRVGRNNQDIAADANDDFGIVLNRGGSAMALAHRGREAALAPGMATLFNHAEPGEVRGQARNAWIALMVPRRQLLEIITDAEDLAGIRLDPARPAVRHLRRYLDMLLEPDSTEEDAALMQHIGVTLLDLVALALGSARDQEQLARLRGLRAARLKELLLEIRARFAEPHLSPEDVGRRLGLSPRYVQDLLHEAGASFTERVLELRLQKARMMLCHSGYERLKVIEIALACGFDSISYFNRRFRARFGASPMQFRSTS